MFSRPPQLIYVLLFLFTSSCQTIARRDSNNPSFGEVAQKIFTKPTDIEHFTKSGPIAFTPFINKHMDLDGLGTITFDYFRSELTGARPLVIISHGNHSWKEAHRYQGERLASFGMDALVLQLPNQKKWLSNGDRIAQVVGRMSPERYLSIILVGHSFGGSAVSVAATKNPSVKGLIYLDPALVHERIKDSLKTIKVPAVILSADPFFFRSRKQTAFKSLIPSKPKRFIVNASTHDDAQFPSMFSVGGIGVDPFTDIEKQNTFTALIVAVALGLSTENTLRYGGLVMQSAIDTGLVR